MNQIEYGLDELPNVAKWVLKNSKSRTLLFYAEMGVGKTTLIKELVKQLDSKDVVSSPTFSLVNEYDSPSGSIFHFDLYRIEDEMEVMDIGFEEYLETEAWIFIEWPEKIPNLLPENTQEVRIYRNEKGKNVLELMN